MTIRINIKILVLMFVTIQTFNNSIGQNIKVQKQLKDFNILKTALLENEAGLFLYNDSLSIFQKLDEVENNLASEKTELEQYRIYSNLLSHIKCGHTQLIPSKRIMRDFYGSACSLPFDVKLVNGKLYALKNYGKSPKISKYDEIISINYQNIFEIMETMRNYISSDGENITFKNKQLGKYFLLYYYFSYGNPTTIFDIKFVKQESDTLEIKIPPTYPLFSDFKEKSKIDNIETKEPFGTLKIMKSANYGIFTFPSFEKSSGRKHKKYIDNCFEKIKKNGVEHLIIDLRDNYGGKNQYYLSSYLGEKSFIYDEISCKGIDKPSYNNYLQKSNKDYFICRKALRRNKNALKRGNPIPTDLRSIFIHPNQFKGRIYVLINGNTCSASSNLASVLKEKCNALIIGEESGGSHKQGNTGRLRLRLPSTKFIAIINPIHYNIKPVNLYQKEDGVIPHFNVREEFPIKRNFDPYVKLALKIILADPETTERKEGDFSIYE